MKNFLFYFSLYLLSCISPLYGKTSHHHFITDLRITSEAKKALKAFEIPGASIGIIHKNEIIYMKSFGYRDLENKYPVTPNTIFPIGSLSKAFTAAITCMLEDEKKLDLNTPAIQYFPSFKFENPYATKHLTLKDLLTHSSGLFRHDFVWYHRKATRQELINTIQYLPLSCDIRQCFQYNNLTYTLIGTIIEHISDMSFEEMVQYKIFDPLKMKNSNFSISKMKESNNFSFPYAIRNNQVQKIPFLDMTNVAPAGGINSNLEDMLQWVKLQLSNGTFNNHIFFKNDTLKSMHTLQFANAEYPEERLYLLGYGLGWLIGNYGGYYLVGHSGEVDGFNAQITLIPKENLGIVILTNNGDTGSDFISCLTNTILDRYLNLSPINWLQKIINENNQENTSEETLQPSTIFPPPNNINLSQYTGSYINQAYGTISIVIKNKQLLVTFHAMQAPLNFLKKDSFEMDENKSFEALKGLPIQFIRSNDQIINSLSIPFQGIDILFEKQ
ncbi:MAG TPA: serine hydrolase [Chlamydiales bacterium]|nr:serine hydrolase [Chlamydiales bacterium]